MFTTGARLCFASRILSTNPGTTYRAAWPGPVWGNGLATITRSPDRLPASSAPTSAAALLVAYGVTGADGVGFDSRQRPARSVDLRRRDDQQHRIRAGRGAPLHQGIHQPHGAERVDVPGAHGVRERGRDRGDAGEMHDPVGVDRSNGANRFGVPEVEGNTRRRGPSLRPSPIAIRRHDGMSQLDEPRHHPVSHEPVGARHQHFHRGRSRSRSASTIIAMSSRKETVGSQPRSRLASDGSAWSTSTSAGRMNAGSVTTCFRQSSPA